MFGLTEVSVSPAAVTAGGRRSDLNPPSPRQLKGKNLRWRDKCGGRQTVEDLPVGDKPLDRGVMSDLGSPGRKGPNRSHGFSKSRKMLVSSTPLDTPVSHAYAAESPLLCPSIRASLVPGPTGRFFPFPRARTHPSWESEWSIYKSSGQHFEEYPGHCCGLSAAPQGHKQEFYPFCAPPPPFPHMMEMTYGLRRREGPNCHTHQPLPPGFLAASYPGPWKELLPWRQLHRLFNFRVVSQTN